MSDIEHVAIRYNGAFGESDIEGKAATRSGEQAGTRVIFNGATGVSDMAGEAAREAVEPSGSERDTMELRGKRHRRQSRDGVAASERGRERVSNHFCDFSFELGLEAIVPAISWSFCFSLRARGAQPFFDVLRVS